MRKHPDQDDAMYLSMRRGKMTISEIAVACGVSARTVYYGIKTARQIEADQARIARAKAAPKLREPTLTIDFGSSCKPLKLLTCADVHPRGRIPEGSPICCGVQDCHQSGMDHLPALTRDPLTDPAPEPKPKAAPKPKQTRKQKRRAAVAA